MPMVQTSLGETLRILRMRQGLTLREVQTRSGVDKSLLCRIERDQCSPRVSDLERIVRVLGTTVAAVLTEDREPHDAPSR